MSGSIPNLMYVCVCVCVCVCVGGGIPHLVWGNIAHLMLGNILCFMSGSSLHPIWCWAIYPVWCGAIYLILCRAVYPILTVYPIWCVAIYTSFLMSGDIPTSCQAIYPIWCSFKETKSFYQCSQWFDTPEAKRERGRGMRKAIYDTWGTLYVSSCQSLLTVLFLFSLIFVIQYKILNKINDEFLLFNIKQTKSTINLKFLLRSRLYRLFEFFF